MLRIVFFAALLPVVSPLQPLTYLNRWTGRATSRISPLFSQAESAVSPLDVAVEAYEVRLPRPLGLSVELGPSNLVAVVKVSGNAEKAGVQVGDAITALGSFFGDAIWAAPKGDDAVDRVESHIALCTEDGGEVLLELHRGAAKRAAAALADDPNMIENAAAFLSGEASNADVRDMWECVFTPEYYSDCEVPPIPGTEESREVDIAKIFDSDK